MRGERTTERLEALRRIYNDHCRLVRSVVVAQGVPDAAVDDVVHDAFLAIHRRMDQRDRDVGVRHFVVSVARNVAFSHRRSAARRQRRLARLAAPEPVPPLRVEDIDARRAWAVVSSFLDELPIPQREVFTMCQLQGLPAAEVAAMLGCSANTVASRLRLVRGKFARRFPDASGLGDHRALLQAAAGRISGSPAQRRRALGALVAQLGSNSLASASSTTAWAGGLAIAAAAVGLTVAFAPPDPALSDPAPPEPATVIAASPPPDPVTLPSGGAAPASPEVTAVADARPSPVQVAAVESPPVSPTQQARTASPPASSKQPAAVVPPPARRDLSAETRLLREAREHLDAGRAQQAQRLLRQHAAQFADGSLARERLRLQIAVRCAQGQRAAARDLARGLAGIQPSAHEVCP